MRSNHLEAWAAALLRSGSAYRSEHALKLVSSERSRRTFVSVSIKRAVDAFQPLGLPEGTVFK